MDPNNNDTTKLPPDPGAHGIAPKVLVVDDEPHIVNFLLDLLKEEGYATESAADGREAVQKIRSEPPEVVISDVMMPKLSGRELVRYLHQSNGKGQPRVILMSAVIDRSPDPAIPLLQKPFDVDALLNLVGDAVGSGLTDERAS